MSHLLIKPSPNSDESLRGYILRLTQENHCLTPFWIYKLADLYKTNIGINLHFINNNMIDLEKLSLLTDQKIEKLLSLTFYSEFGKYYEDSTSEIYSIIKWGILGGRTMICPKCLEENPYLRKSWDIGLYTCCPKHQCLLVEKCSKCNKYITNFFNSSKTTKCNCGFDLRNVPLNKIDAEELGFASLIDLHLRNSQHSAINTNPLNTLELRHILYLFIFVSLHIAKYYHNTNYQLCNLPITTRHNIVCKAYFIFLDWPDSLYKFMEEFRKIPKNNSLTGIKKEFGDFYSDVYKKFNQPAYEFFKNGFENYLLNYWDGGQLKRFKNKTKDHKFISGDKARIVLKTDYLKVIELIQLGEIEGVIRTRNEKKQILVNNQSLEQYIERQKRFISLTQVSHRLGVTTDIVKKIANNGLINVIKSPQKNGTKFWVIDAISVDQLLNQLDKFAKINFDHLNDHLISLPEALHLFRKSATSLIRSVINGELSPLYKVDGPLLRGLKAYYFNKNDVTMLVNKDIAPKKISRINSINSYKPNTEHYTQREIARILGVNENAIGKWVKKGYLLTEIIKEGCFITNTSLQKFQEKYLSLQQLCTMYDEYPNSILQKLLSFGVLPVLKKDGEDQGSPYLFYAEEALLALSSTKNKKYYSARQLSKELKISSQAINSWVKKGYLSTELFFGKKLISQKEVESFQREYLSLSQLTKLTNKQEPFLYRQLCHKGIFPLIKGENDDGKPYLYKKSEIMWFLESKNWE